MRLTYAHQVRPESDLYPFELRQTDVQVKIWPPDYWIDNRETYQVIDIDGKPLSNAESTVSNALENAAISLMWKNRKL